MRTTITLDDDLAVRLEQRREDEGKTFKDILNETVRLGLDALEAGRDTGTGEVIRTEPLPLGRRLLTDVNDVADALAIAEGEDYR